MFCRNCGKQIDDKADVCIYCGVKTKDEKTEPTTVVVKPIDKGSFGWGVLGFFFPLVGLILYGIWYKDLPKRARSVGIGALIDLCLGIFILIVYFILAIVIVNTTY